MSVCIFPGPKRSRILINELIDVLILWVLYCWVLFCLSPFLLEEVHNTCWFSNFKSTVLIIVHTIPRVLTSNGQTLTTIDVDNLACNFVGMLSSQVNDCMAYFFNFCCPSHWIRIGLFLHNWIIFKLCQTCLSIQICVQERTWYTIASNTKSSQFYSGWFCKHFKASFTHTIGYKSRLWFWTFDTRNIDNASLGCDKHILKEIDQNIGCSEIDIH